MDKPMSYENSHRPGILCPNCGEQILQKINCPSCGMEVDPAVDRKPDESFSGAANQGANDQPMAITESRLSRPRTFLELTRQVYLAEDINELLRRSVEKLVDSFGYIAASIYLVESSDQTATLSEFKSSLSDFQVSKGAKIRAGSQSLIGNVLMNRVIRIRDDANGRLPTIGNEVHISSEIGIPILTGDVLYAILDIQHNQPGVFDQEAVSELEEYASSISQAVTRLQSQEKNRAALQVVSLLYDASYRLTQVTTIADMSRVVSSALQYFPYTSALFSVDRGGLSLLSERITDHANQKGPSRLLAYPARINIRAGMLESEIGLGVEYKIVDFKDPGSPRTELPIMLYSIPSQAGCNAIALIPGWNADKLELLMVLGANNIEQLDPQNLLPYTKLANMACITQAKTNTSQRLEKRLAALQSLNAVSQVVSVGTELNSLYKVIHREVTSIMGKVNFAIATYDPLQDTITIPYMYDGQTTRSVDTFPVGEGLTSILIRTKKSLMVVEDTERKTRELGAKLVGKPAKSWLGVPLLVGGDVIGAILLQDLENEGRFDEDDQLLLETLASQVAITIRNARLLEGTYQQATRQQMLYEITSKIRNQSSIPEIMETTASELSRALGVKQARIDIGVTEHERPEVVPDESQSRDEISQYERDAWEKAAAELDHRSYVYTSDQNMGPGEDQSTVSIPIMLRDQVIGEIILGLSTASLSPEDQTFVEQVSYQAALAMENVRLLEDTQRRANHELLVAKIVNKARASTDVDTILRTTLGELGRSLQASEGLIYLDVSLKADSSTSNGGER